METESLVHNFVLNWLQNWFTPDKKMRCSSVCVCEREWSADPVDCTTRVDCVNLRTFTTQVMDFKGDFQADLDSARSNRDCEREGAGTGEGGGDGEGEG